MGTKICVSGAPSCASSAPQSLFTTAISGTFYAYAYGVQNAARVVFPTWGDPGGQDDIVWYEGTNMGGGTWRAAINLANHKVGNPEYGQFYAHIYMLNLPTYSYTWCGVADFNRDTSATNDASCVNITAPSSVTAGQVFPASVTMQNTGGKTWTSDATPHNLGSQNPQDNLRWGLNRVGLPSASVSTGQQAVFNFNAIAPATAGSYPFDWRMVEDGIRWCGQTCQKTITVNIAGLIDIE